MQLAVGANARVPDESADALHEIPSVALGLETYEVVGEQGRQERVTLGKLEEDVRRGKGDMEEERQAVRTAEFPQMVGHVHQLIVMDPDEILGPALFRYGFRESPVHPDVGVPVVGNEVALGLEIVEERPQGLVRVAMIVAVHLLGVDGYRPQDISHILRRPAQEVR